MMQKHSIARAVSGARWNPRDGLIGKDQGLWLDPSDQSTLYTTSVSTTPGVAVGSPVGKILDKSGNGHIASTPDASRPILKQDAAGNYYLEFSGAQYLTFQSSTGTFKFLHSDKNFISVAARFGTVSDPNDAYLLLGNSGASAIPIGASYWFDDRVSSTRNNAISYILSDGGGPPNTAAAVSQNIATPNTNLILSVTADPTNATAAERVAIHINNGSAIKDNTESAAASTGNAAYDLQIGSGGNNVAPMVGRIYQLVIANKQVTADQFARCKTFMARKAGVTW